MKTIGVIIADNYEYSPFMKWAAENGSENFSKNGFNMLTTNFLGKNIVAIEAGIGKVNAATAAAEIIINNNVEEIYNIGFSGAVHGVRRGNIVAGESCMECDFDLRPLGYELGVKPDQKYIYETDETLTDACRKVGLNIVKLGTGDMFLTSDEIKKDFYSRFGISAFDMESGAIAAVCDKYDIPFLSIRKISDDCAESAAEDYREMNESEEIGLTDTLLKVLRAMQNG